MDTLTERGRDECQILMGVEKYLLYLTVSWFRFWDCGFLHLRSVNFSSAQLELRGDVYFLELRSWVWKYCSCLTVFSCGFSWLSSELSVEPLDTCTTGRLESACLAVNLIVKPLELNIVMYSFWCMWFNREIVFLIKRFNWLKNYNPSPHRPLWLLWSWNLLMSVDFGILLFLWTEFWCGSDRNCVSWTSVRFLIDHRCFRAITSFRWHLPW